MTDDSRVGTVIADKYRLDAELGRGGMGAVYRAFHLRVHKEFAIKVLLAEVAGHRQVAQRFFLEAQAAGRIGHPGILDVYDVGEDAHGAPFIVMELLHGEPLSTLLRRKRLEPRAACWIAAQVLDVLDAAHRAGVVHRDVKPQNVFLCEGPSRTVKLLDFGIAKFSAASDASAITRSGEIIGSPLYMAPEQAKGEADVDARVDVWSVGAMLFEMLTGAPAHRASTPVAVLAKILTEPAPPPSRSNGALPPDLDAIVQRALAIDRSARFASARAMLDALHDVGKKLGWSDAPPDLGIVARRGAAVIAGETTSSTSAAIASTIESGSPAVPPPESAGRAPMAAEAPPGRPSSRKIAVPMLAVVAAGFVAWGVTVAATKDAKEPAASAPAPTPPPIAPASAAAPEPEPEVEPEAQAPSAAPSASASASASKPAAAPISPPRCASGEVLSHGHCCPRGLVWQAGRCERPLATSF